MGKPTIGSVWQDKSGNKWEVTAVNGSVQLSYISGELGARKEGYKIIKDSSLRKNYTCIALKVEKKVNIIPEKVPELKKPVEKNTEEICRKVPGKRGLIELEDGRIIKGTEFMATMTTVKLKYPSDAIYWLRTTKAGQQILSEKKAKIVYGKLN